MIPSCRHWARSGPRKRPACANMRARPESGIDELSVDCVRVAKELRFRVAMQASYTELSRSLIACWGSVVFQFSSMLLRTLSEAQIPSGCFWGPRSGRIPSEQHMGCCGARVVQNDGPGLYWKNCSVVVAHREMRLAHDS